MFDFPKKCPFNQELVSDIKKPCRECHFYDTASNQCKIVQTDNNVKKILAILSQKKI